jgi:UV DNA damage endonuclease
MSYQVGYCCINNTLNKKGITTGRTMRKATFEQKGLPYVSELATKNIEDLITILQWNEQHGIKVFRVSSNLFPWNSEYKLEQLAHHEQHLALLQQAGHIIKRSGQRVSAHPDHFVKLGSANDRVVKNSIHDLEHHSEMFDLLGLSVSHYNPLNIHVGMNYSKETVLRWLQSFDKLSDNCKKRLVVENDDKASGFSVQQLFDDIYKQIHIPITFDYFHHEFHSDNLTAKEAATLAVFTWDTKPLFHYSESKNLNEQVSGNPRAHSDYVFKKIDTFGLHIDIDLEAKAKELAYFKYMEI